MGRALLLTLLAFLLVPATALAQGGGTTPTTPTPTVPAAPGADTDAAPTDDQVAAAVAYLKGRRGARKAFAVIDTKGRLSGWNADRRFVTASVVKAMLLVAYLRRVDAAGRGLTVAERALLGPMIRVSDNDAATAIWRRVGDIGLRRVAALVGMTRFLIGPQWIRSCRCSARAWARAQITAGDQARLFAALDRVLPARFLAYGKNLLETVVADSSWGIPSVARPLGWRAFWKVGLRATGLGGLIHQAARLEDGDRVMAIAVLTDGDPTYLYGKGTVAGVAQRLVGPATSGTPATG
jgi:hypothetical protein